jgi:hypothetical protein
MKSSKFFLGFFAILILIFFIVSDTSCKKNENSTDPNNTNNSGGTGGGGGTNSDQSRNENWLIGTWEGITSGSLEEPFNNKKVRIVFTEVKLKQEDNLVENQTYRIYAYSGTFTWNADGTGWSMEFKEQNFPQPGYNVIIWGCNSMYPATQFLENISLRINDTANVDLNHSVNLDMTMAGTTGSSITALDFIGDIEIESNGIYARAEFPQEQPLHLVKK